MASDELSPDEQELIRKHRADRDAEARKGDADLRVWLRNADGDEVDLPYSKARPFVQQRFGLDLDDEPAQDAPEGAAGKDAPPAAPGGEVRRFGRRMA